MNQSLDHFTTSKATLQPAGSYTAMNNSHHTAPLPADLDAIIAEGLTPVEIVENVEMDKSQFNEFNNFNSSPPPERVHPIPEDSLLDDVVAFAREFTEAPDSFTVAPMITLVGGILTPKTYWNFAGKKFPNVFQFVVGPPGIRKSTSFGLVELIAKKALASDAFHEGNASDSAAFEKWSNQPHRIQLEDEGNTLVSSWRGSYSGKEMANRYLKLYDGKSWAQTFRHQATEGNDAGELSIPCATLSLAIGATFSVCRFEGVDAKSGLRRRFGYYVASEPARMIPWPKETEDCEELDLLVEALGRISGIEGVFNFDAEAMLAWTEFQGQNRDRSREIGPPDNEAAEIRCAELSEWPSRVLKLAAIFQASRWAKTEKGDPLLVDVHSLTLAASHQDACLEASSSVESIARRAEITDDADKILATMRSEAANPSLNDRWQIEKNNIVASKSEIIRRFAANGNRGITSYRLHTEIMPIVIRAAGGLIDGQRGGATS
jgi:hypothetical protein